MADTITVLSTPTGAGAQVPVQTSTGGIATGTYNGQGSGVTVNGKTYY